MTVKAFQNRRIAEQPSRLRSVWCPDALTHHLIHWFPADVGSVAGAAPNLNESAHVAARDLTDRDSSARIADSPPPYGQMDAPATYNAVTKFMYMFLTFISPPHPS